MMLSATNHPPYPRGLIAHSMEQFSEWEDRGQEAPDYDGKSEVLFQLLLLLLINRLFCTCPYRHQQQTEGDV